MREQLLKWIEQRRADLASIGITTSKVHIGLDESPNPGAFVDHETPTALGEIIIWESGEMEVQAFRIEDGEPIFWHYQLEGEPNFDLLLQDYLKVLTGANA